jgi:hypothetical protein
MSHRIDDYVNRFVAGVDDVNSVDRRVDVPCGLTPVEMNEALAHARFADDRAFGIQMMADFMKPEGSRYFDAIYGSFHGQAEIRQWLVPTMASIDFIDFRPMAEPVFLDDGEGTTSVDEWQMFMGEIPLSRGVSVRRYRDGWITWACDVYDTALFRQPGPDGETAPLPAPPSPGDWTRDPRAPTVAAKDVDFDADCDQFHPTDSVYLDPIFGEFHGRENIRTWMVDIMGKVGDIEFVPVGPELNDGSTYVQEWVQMAVTPDGRRVPMTRGTSVRRYRDGHTVHAADYFDTATVMQPDVLVASVECGSRITVDDIMRYRSS